MVTESPVTDDEHDEKEESYNLSWGESSSLRGESKAKMHFAADEL
jgi:hypothetical protein